MLIVLFVNLCAADSENGAGGYGGYAIRPYQILGLLCFIFAMFIFFVGLLVPEVYEPLARTQIGVLPEVSAEKELNSSSKTTLLKEDEEC